MISKNIVVIKLGGSSLDNPNTLCELSDLVHGYLNQGIRPVLVHGGGPAINQELTARNITWEFINGQRRTTLEMMDVIEQVLTKKVNTFLVEHLRQKNISAIGTSGAESDILFCTQADEKLEQVGKIETVHTQKIFELLLSKDLTVPVIAPIGIGKHGEKYNINADWAAAKIATALAAKKLIFLTDQNGILDEDKNLISTITPSLIGKLIDEKVITGGMFTKVNTMLAALNQGIKEVSVLNSINASQSLKNKNLGTTLVEAIN